LQSVSRLAPRLCTPEQKQAAIQVRETLAMHERSEDLINLGAYASGANPKLDAAIRVRPLLLDFLKQDSDEQAPFEKTMAGLSELARLAGTTRT
jgi:flagellar biosynthesis/type III secretory pathway ATPase